MRSYAFTFTSLGAVALAALPAQAQSSWSVADGVRGVEVRSDEHGHRASARFDSTASDPASTTELVASNWQALGPFGGDIEDVQVSPTDANLVLAAFAPSSGAGGGVFRSADAGASWSPVASLANRACYDLAFAPDGTAYAGTIDGVWKSTNGGTSFTAQNLGIGVNDQVFEVDVDPTDPTRIWCGVADAIGNQPVNVMLSVNSGATWTNRTPPLAAPTSCTAISIDPTNNQKVYAGFGGGFGGGQLWVSTNGGTSWVNRSAGLPNTPVKDIVHDGARALVTGGQLFGSQNFGLFSTVNDGLSWTPLHDGTWPTLVVHDIAIDPNDVNVLLLATAGKGLFRSIDGGASWAFQIGGTGSLSVNAVSFEPTSSTAIYTGSSSAAVWKSTDAAASFNAASNGISALDVYSVGSNPLDENEIAIAFQGPNNGGVFTTVDGGQSWTLEAVPGTRYSNVRFTSTGQLYAISSGPSSVAPEGLYRRTGASWTSIGPNQGTLFESDLATMRFSENDPSQIWAGGADFGVAGSEPTIWHTTVGGGASWTKVYEGPSPNEFVRDLHIVDPPTDTTLLAAFVDFGTSPQTGGVLRSTTGGTAWLPSGAGLSPTAQCSSFADSPANPGVVYVSSQVFSGQQGVYRSADGGQSWTGTGFVGQVLHVVADAFAANTLYIAQGNAIKVQASTDDGATFAPYNSGLASAGAVRELRRSLGPGSKLLLASSTGAYSTDLGTPSFTPFCAGDGSLATACPCGNTGASGRGCDNSAGTGGALLTATGSVSPDTVVLSSSGELASVTTIFLQGTVDNVSGVFFGDGVRCVGGDLKRMYVTNAIGGTATAPGGGDPSITTQSAILGDPIAPGQTRYYQAYYRDPDLGFCPAPPGNSWNVSSGLSIVW